MASQIFLDQHLTPDLVECTSPIVSDVDRDGQRHCRFMIDLARRSMHPVTKTVAVCEAGRTRLLRVTRHGVGPLVTEEGSFWEFKFSVSDEWSEYSVIAKCDLRCTDFAPIFHDRDRILLRIDSGCQTGQQYGDLTCDCREQLRLAMSAIEHAGEGLIVCIPQQDGRGKGGSFKLASLWLQSKLGLNTVEAACLLAEGKPIDVRSFAGAIAVLKYLGCSATTRLGLMTNNPQKLNVFEENGLPCDTIPHVIPPTDLTHNHLEAKGRCLGHSSLIQDESIDLRSKPVHLHEGAAG